MFIVLFIKLCKLSTYESLNIEVPVIQDFIVKLFLMVFFVAPSGVKNWLCQGAEIDQS